MHASTFLPGSLAERAREAIAIAGGGAKLARALNIRRSAVQAWKTTRVPAGQVPAIARITGLSLHDLRPDLFDAPAIAPTADTEQPSEAA